MDENRFYYGYKLAKDFVILASKDSRTYLTSEGAEGFDLKRVRDLYFEKGALVNYLNEMTVEMMDLFFSVAESDWKIAKEEEEGTNNKISDRYD